MTVAFRAVGTWENGATGLTADEVVAVPAAQAVGDMMLLIGCWKDYAITASVAGWTELIQNADGTTATGNGTGSMKIGVWYKEATADPESDPTLDFSTTTGLLGEAVIMVFSKSLSFWQTPVARTAPWFDSAGPASTGTSAVDLSDGGAVVAVAAIRDDSATFTRSTTSITNGTGSVTWNGNYVESPATHASTTTGNDMSCDAGYRLITTGGAGVELSLGITALSASETGNMVAIVLGDTNSSFTPVDPTGMAGFFGL